MIDLSIVILTFNSEGFIEDCIKSLISSKAIGFNGFKNFKTVKFLYSAEILVIDNNSRDNTVKLIKNEFSFVQLVENKENIGFSKGNNIGFKKSKGRYILLLNPDSFVDKNTLYEMIRFMDKDENIGISTCFVELVKSKTIDWASHRGFPTPWASFTYYSKLSKLFPKSRLFSRYHLTYKNLSKQHSIDSPVGAFYLIRRKLLDDIGYLDEDYFMYAEDLDFSFRAKERGWKVMYYPKVKTFHYKGMSSGLKKNTSKESVATKIEKERAFNSFYDTMKLFYKKHYENKYYFWVKWLVFLGIETKRFFSKIINSV